MLNRIQDVENDLHQIRVQLRVWPMDAGMIYREMLVERRLQALKNGNTSPLFPAFAAYHAAR